MPDAKEAYENLVEVLCQLDSCLYVHHHRILQTGCADGRQAFPAHNGDCKADSHCALELKDRNDDVESHHQHQCCTESELDKEVLDY